MEKADFNADVFGSKDMLQPAPVDKIPAKGTRPDIAYQMVKDETFAQTQPRLNMATFVTTYMDKHATKLMNEAIALNYIDETENPRVAVMCASVSTFWPTSGIRLNRTNGRRVLWLLVHPKHVCWVV